MRARGLGQQPGFDVASGRQERAGENANSSDMPVNYIFSCIVVPMMNSPASKLDAMAMLGRALADRTRCRLLMALISGPGYPAQLAAALDVSPQVASNHLACLRGCGLVVATYEGRRVRYELVDANLAHALTDLLDVVLAIDDTVACLSPEARTPSR